MSETIYGMDLDDAQEPTCVEGGEYKIRCVGFRKDKEGNIVRTYNRDGYDMPYVLVMLDIPSEPTSKDFTHFVGLPTTEEGACTPKDLNQTKWKKQKEEAMVRTRKTTETGCNKSLCYRSPRPCRPM